jgi:hypothetical protein
MNFSTRQCLAPLLGLVLVPTLAAAQEAESGHRWSEKVKRAFSNQCGPIRIMPPNAIVVLDPGVDPRGDPKVMLRQTADESGLTVEVPETVHVHKYFPCGSREFQAQYFAGGPTIVAARHPYTHERVNVHLELSPGFPVVKYEDDKIEYKYPEETFSIHFSRCGDVKTAYSGCPTAKLRTKTAARALKDKTLDCTEQLGINKLCTTVCNDARDCSAGTAEAAGHVVEYSTNIVVTAVNLVPGVKTLKSTGADRATKERDRAVQRVTRERADLEEDIKTVR